MTRRQVGFAESALRDFEEVLAGYTEQGVPAVGKRQVTEVFAQVEVLADHPETGRKVPEFDISTLRELIHSPFQIVYRHDPGTSQVQVVRVWRSERVLKLPD